MKLIALLCGIEMVHFMLYICNHNKKLFKLKHIWGITLLAMIV